MMPIKTPRAALVAATATVFLSACSSVVQNPPPMSAVNAMTAKAASADYQISTGDELDMRFVYTPELNTTVTVRPDGKISAPLVGDVKVAGLSPAQVSEQLRSAYANQVKRPEVSVNVRGFASQRVFVGGEVAQPGAQQLAGHLSVLDAIMSAQGYKDTARLNEVVIVRRGDDGKRVVFPVNLEKVIDGEDATQDVLLRPYDVVIVPKSGIANVNLWVDQYIRKNLPINFGVNYSVTHTTNSGGGGTVVVPAGQ